MTPMKRCSKLEEQRCADSRVCACNVDVVDLAELVLLHRPKNGLARLTASIYLYADMQLTEHALLSSSGTDASMPS
jgi:hypothetical protein